MITMPALRESFGYATPRESQPGPASGNTICPSARLLLAYRHEPSVDVTYPEPPFGAIWVPAA
jgi:hypothetical protein